jgi:hypothetical protein
MISHAIVYYKYILLHLILFSSVGVSVKAQGILNNGGNIVLNSAVTVYINGTTGHYTNQNSGLIKSNTSGGTINMFGNWINNTANSAFQNDGANVILSGADQTIGGSNSTSFYNLTLSGSGTKYLSVSPITVGGQSTFNGVLSLGTRPLSLNSNRLNISNAATTAITYSTGYIISETNAAVNPSIINWKTGTNTGSYVFPFGVSGTQIPLTFSITSAMAVSTDNVSISTRATAGNNNSPWTGVTNVPAVSSMNSLISGVDASVQVIDRWWNITPSAAVTASVTFRYRGTENTLSAPYNTASIGAQHWNGTYWETPVGAATGVMSGVGAVTATGLNSFSPYVLTALAIPLPIELLNFDYSCDNKNILFNWCTATENNNDYFTLWHSADGINFIPLTTIPGQGNSTSKKCYDFLLESKDINSNYFRLSQTDFDGTTESFKVIFTEDCLQSNELITVSNSDLNQLQINMSVLNAGSYELSIVNSLGQHLKKERLQIQKGANVFNYNLTGLATGIYHVQLYNKEKSFTKKIVIH